MLMFLFILNGIFQVQNGLYAQKVCLLVDYSFNPVSGGFKGKSVLTGNDHVFIIPKLKGGFGYGIALGTKVVENGHTIYAGLKYARTKYDATFLDKSYGIANHNLFGIEFKWFSSGKKNIILNETLPASNKKQIIQYYLSFGAEAGNLKVKDGHYLLSSPDLFHDANFIWGAIPFGIGISISPVKVISLNLGAGYRLTFVTGVKEVGSKEDALDLKDNLGMGGVRCDVGLSFLF